MKQPLLKVEIDEGRFFKPLRFEIESGAGAIISAGSTEVLDALLEQVFGLGEAPGRHVCLTEERLDDCREKDLLERLGALGYAAGDGGLIGNIRVWENLVLPLHGRRGAAQAFAADEVEDQIISAFGAASVGEKRAIGLMPQSPDRLSAFERIICTLVRCHVSGFRLLVCDRIFDGLDEGRSRRVSALVDWLGHRHEGSALLVLRHSTRPVENEFGLKGWTPIDNIELEEKSWLVS